jgi:hypothetical protein
MTISDEMKAPSTEINNRELPRRKPEITVDCNRSLIVAESTSTVRVRLLFVGSKWAIRASAAMMQPGSTQPQPCTTIACTPVSTIGL